MSPATHLPADAASSMAKRGVLYALAAYGAWGLFPLYWKALSLIEPVQILACRVLFSLILVWIILAAQKRADWPRILGNKKVLARLLCSATLIGVNWGFYIWAVNSGHTVDASLGYYINPLVNIVLGLVFFKERLNLLQWVAVALASAGVLVLSLGAGSFPWIAIVLGFSFGLYGLTKKNLPVDPLSALGAETLILAPLAAAWLLFRALAGQGAFAVAATGGLPAGSTGSILLLIGSGLATTFPLLWFAIAAGRLPLSAMGFIQFVSPSIQLLIGVFLFKERFGPERWAGFIPVWAALSLYLASILWRNREIKARGDRASLPS
jgi:chloramphenicol-sensitive protein RarD